MADREIRAREVVNDIRAGMGRDALMNKYKLSPRGLQNLFEELTNLGLLERTDEHEIIPGRQRIKIRAIVGDVKAGMSDSQMMAKYHIDHEALQALFKKLLDLKAISRDALFGEVGLACETSVPTHVRESDRYVLDFDIPVYEEGLPEIQGRVHDITEKGVGIRGLSLKVNEVKTLVVLGDAFGVVAPFDFRAICRWSGLDQEDGLYAAGFQILEISDRSMGDLRKLIKLIAFG
jgi:uncharacterized protein (DUF433 family)